MGELFLGVGEAGLLGVGLGFLFGLFVEGGFAVYGESGRLLEGVGDTLAVDLRDLGVQIVVAV